MKNKLIFTTILALLIFPLLTSAQAQANQEKYKAFFQCAAGGDSLIVTKWGVFPWGGPMMKEWFIGRSMVAFAGSGEVDQQPPSYYTSSGIRAGGGVFACWEKQMISVLLYSKGEAGGRFWDDAPVDLFSVGMEAGMGLVYYKGTYIDATGTHAVNGQAVVSVAFAPGSTIEMMSVSFLKPDGTILLSIILFNADLSAAPWGVQRAPNYFAQSVRISALS